jgi:hypothetical protein
MMNGKVLAAAMAVTLVGSTFAASNPFSDVPRTHWAYEAISRAVEAGILQGFDGKFHGEKLVNRYQMAVIIKKMLDKVGSMGGSSGSGMKAEDIQNLEALTIEFADELALLNVKVSTLEDSFVELRNEVDALKSGRGASAHAASMGGAGLANAFTGFISVGLVNTDDGTQTLAGVPVPGPAPANTRYTNTTPDQTFFTIPQVSVAVDTEVSDGVGLHVQYDYGTDANNQPLAAGLGGPIGGLVGLNEAYIFVDELFGDVGGKIGGFALPFQSWEVNGPFRTLNDTITPSAKNTFMEGIRVVGIEASKTKNVDPSDVQWRLGIFTGGDIPTATGPIPLGLMNDGVGQAGLSRSFTNDDSFGYYLDIESGNDPDKSWGWRLGFFDLGGDLNVGALTAAPSHEISGYQVGFWWKNDDFKVQLEWMNADDTYSAAPGTPDNEMNAWYVLVNWKMNEDSSVSLRYDDWTNDNWAGVATPGADVDLEGDSFTFAWNRKISDTSMFQFEYLSVDQDYVGAIPGGVPDDVDDDLVQFRYKVWF